MTNRVLKTKGELIQAILCLIPDANEAHLKTRTIGQLRETLGRWEAISRTTEREIRTHCDVSFIR